MEMTEVNIPFSPDMAQASINGKKRCTSRTKAYGWKGDTFAIDGTRFVIEWVERMTLGQVAEEYYLMEGFQTPLDFRNKWNALHPRKRFVQDQEVYVHFFEEVR